MRKNQPTNSVLDIDEKGWKEALPGKTDLADLHHGHGDAVELVLTGAGDEHFLGGAEAQAEDVLFVRLTRVVALQVHRNLPKMQDSSQGCPHTVGGPLGFQSSLRYFELTGSWTSMVPGSTSEVEKGGFALPLFLWVFYSPLSD